MDYLRRLEPLWLALVIIAGLNWAFVALFDWNIVTAIFGSMLLFLLATGITADDLTATAALGIGTTLGLALVFLGFRIKPGSGRSYLD